MPESKLPSAVVENESLRLEYLTTTGPRITGLYARGAQGNPLAETPNVHWGTPHGEYYLRGGHRLWTAPENPFYTCPENGLDVIEGKENVRLRSPIDASGMEKEIAIELDENCVHLSHRVTWHGEQPIELAPWAITQIRLGGMAILPLSSKEGLLPNRKLVLWPYSQINDDRFELQNDLVLLYGHAKDFAFKVGNLNSFGWIACALGDSLFVKHFAMQETDRYPDLGCNVEAYVKNAFIELESLGPLAILKPGESVVHEETWELFTGDYPATLDSARNIIQQLSQS